MEGCQARANVYLETFACEASEPFLLCGEAVAGAVRSVGSGRAWLLGTFVGHNGTAYRDAETWAFVGALLAECGVRPEHQGEPALRRRAIEGKEAWLFTNPTNAEVTERVDVSGWSRVEDLLREPLAQEGDSVHLTVDPLGVRVLVLEK